jgi:ssDNA thymidine ADP-ribosyltransferase, DarT
MSPVPPRPKIYHISHGKNLASILSSDCLWSDAEMIQRGGPDTAIGLSGIKQRRLTELSVSCHPGTKVGEFVPFYFCRRSLMLFLIHCRNLPN